MNSTVTIDVEALTAQITQRVTYSVLSSLQQSGLFPSTTTTSTTLQEDSKLQNGDKTLERQLQPSNADLLLPNVTDASVRNTALSSSSREITFWYPKLCFLSCSLTYNSVFFQRQSLRSGLVVALIFRLCRMKTLRIQSGADGSTVTSKKKFISMEQWTNALICNNHVTTMLFTLPYYSFKSH